MEEIQRNRGTKCGRVCTYECVHLCVHAPVCACVELSNTHTIGALGASLGVRGPLGGGCRERASAPGVSVWAVEQQTRQCPPNSV